MKLKGIKLLNIFQTPQLDFYDKIFLFFLILIYYLRIYLFNFTNLVQYPYQFPDSWSWLSDGLHIAGYNTQMSFRPPVFSLLIAFFYKIGMEDLIILSGQVFSIVASIGIYALASKLYNKEIGLYSGILLLTNGYLLSYSAHILADILGLALITLTFYLFFEGISSKINNSKYLYFSGFTCALAFLTQYNGILIVITIIIYSIFQREQVWGKKKELLTSLLIFILISSQWFIYRWVQFGDPFYSKVTHLGLLKFRYDSIYAIFFYFLNSFIFISLICIFLAIYGLYKLNYEKNLTSNITKKNDNYMSTIFILIWIAVFFVFFVFIYSWNDERFIIYWIAPIIILSSAGISYVRKEIQVHKYNKSFFIIIFIFILLITNITFVSSQDSNYMIRSISSIEEISFQNIRGLQINLAYLNFYQNRGKFLDGRFIFIPGYFANIDPFILPSVGRYISNNSGINDIIAIKPGFKEGGYWYIFNNQLAVVAKRQTVSIDLRNNSKVKFIIVQLASTNNLIPEFENFDMIGYAGRYILYTRTNL